MASVLIAQTTEDQEKLWKAALTSQGLVVIVESPKTDLTQYLKELKLSGKEVPGLVLMDMGITTTDSSSLQAVEVCRWCSKFHPQTKVLLNNSKQDQILPLKRRWANRLGAEDLLPRLYSENLNVVITRVAEVANFSLSTEALQQVFDTFIRSEVSAPTIGMPTQGKRLRDVKAEEVVRKLAALTSTINEVYAGDNQETQIEGEEQPSLAIDATIHELTLHQFELHISRPGQEAIRFLEENTLIPGVILNEDGEYRGFLSRRRILEMLAKPFGQELFMKRPLSTMYDSGALDVLILSGSTSVVSAAVSALRRPESIIYEPIVVQIDEQNHRMLDLHDLLLAQLEIQEIATKMLREQAQARMVQMEKMASLGQMLAEVSHDIRNPVNFIYGNVEYLQNYAQTLIETIQTYQQENLVAPAEPQESETTENLEYILQDLPKIVDGIRLGAEQLRNLVTGLQSFSHMEEVVPDVLDIHECIDSSLTILSNRIKGKVEVVRSFGKDIPEVLGFQGQLIQVFMNIFSNALDAIADKSTHLSHSWQPTITVSTFEEDGYLAISITDNGNGIPPEIQARIFDSFFTTKGTGKGTGLGMAITHQIIVEKHNGKLLVNSPYTVPGGTTPVTGTEFRVLLPIS